MSRKRVTKPKKVTNSPKAPFKFKRHILAPVTGLLVFVAFFGLMNFQWIQAQAMYKFAPPLASDASTTEVKSPADITGPTITIPKLRVAAPIVFLADTQNSSIEQALKQGVVHYGASVSPGQRGNSVIFGHSSGLAWDDGNYKFVFTLLDKLQKDDKIIIDSNGTRYTYAMTGSSIVQPDDMTVLNQTTNNTLTLITCTPVGTSSKRLVVTAQQISPKPAAVTAKDAGLPSPPHPVTSFDLPGQSPSFWQSIKNLF